MKTGIAAVLLAASLAAPTAAHAAETPPLDRMPAGASLDDPVSLQRGAHTYVNYCLGCHSASYMRYNRLTDLGLTESQIRDFLILAEAKVGDLMKNSMDPRDAKEWFGAPPPDLTVIARSRSSHAGSGADWLYTYLRSFYRDSARPLGWNNKVFPNVGMPHVLYALQGEQALRTETVLIPRGSGKKEEARRVEVERLVIEKPGTLTPAEYDRMVADLVNFMVYMSEPGQQFRKRLGLYVLLFLGVFFVLAYALKKEYWKNLH